MVEKLQKRIDVYELENSKHCSCGEVRNYDWIYCNDCLCM